MKRNKTTRTSKSSAENRKIFIERDGLSWGVGVGDWRGLVMNLGGGGGVGGGEEGGWDG